MKSALKIFNKHPVSVIFYILYFILCCLMLISTLRFHALMKAHPENSGIANGGEAIGWSWFFFTPIVLIFLSIGLLNALARKQNNQFYWWLCLAIIAPVIILLNIKDILL